MSKIIVKACVKENGEEIGHKIETQGILNNNKINYCDGDICVTINIFNNKIEMTRKSNDYTLYLNFIEGKKMDGYYYLNSMKTNLKLAVTTNRLAISPGNIEVEYRLNDSYTPEKSYFFSLKYAIIK